MNPNHYPPHLQEGFETVAAIALSQADIEINPGQSLTAQLDGYNHYEPRYKIIGDARAAIIASMVTGEVATLDIAAYEV